MKKILFLFLLVFLTNYSFFAQKPNVILGIAKETKTVDYYETQSRLWKKETEKDSKNNFAWWQYYRAKRSFFQLKYSELWAKDQPAIFKKLRPIVDEIKENIPNSYEYFLVEAGITEGETKIKFLKKAYQTDPDRTDIYEGLLIHFATKFLNKDAEEISQKMIENNYYSNASLYWNYNALQSTEPNSVFIGNGDMDMIPKWVLQNGKGVREDVILVSKWKIASDDDYRQKILRKIGISNIEKNQKDFSSLLDYSDYLVAAIMKKSPRKVYMSSGTSVKFFQKMGLEQNIYLVGTAVVYSKNDFDNLKLTVDNFENVYQLDYLLHNFQTHREDEMVKKYMNLTYLPGLIKVKDYFESKNNSKKVSYYSSLIQKIARESGRASEVMSWFKKK